MQEATDADYISKDWRASVITIVKATMIAVMTSTLVVQDQVKNKVFSLSTQHQIGDWLGASV